MKKVKKEYIKMPKRNYEVKLSEEERLILKKIVSTGKSPAKKILRSNILLSTDEKRVPKQTIRKVAEIYGVSTTTVNEVRKSYSENGLESTINRKKRETPPVEPKITGDIEAKIIALSCTEAPTGYSRWTLRLLTKKVIELGYIDSIGRTSVNEVLKKRVTAPPK
jgi:transposase